MSDTQSNKTAFGGYVTVRDPGTGMEVSVPADVYERLSQGVISADTLRCLSKKERAVLKSGVRVESN